MPERDQTDGGVPARARRTTPPCPDCGGKTRFEDGRQIHDLWAERFTCEACGTETYRSFGRGSV